MMPGADWKQVKKVMVQVEIKVTGHTETLRSVGQCQIIEEPQLAPRMEARLQWCNSVEKRRKHSKGFFRGVGRA
jgi:hypothetical protein